MAIYKASNFRHFSIIGIQSLVLKNSVENLKFQKEITDQINFPNGGEFCTALCVSASAADELAYDPIGKYHVIFVGVDTQGNLKINNSDFIATPCPKLCTGTLG